MATEFLIKLAIGFIVGIILIFANIEVKYAKNKNESKKAVFVYLLKILSIAFYGYIFYLLILDFTSKDPLTRPDLLSIIIKSSGIILYLFSWLFYRNLIIQGGILRSMEESAKLFDRIVKVQKDITKSVDELPCHDPGNTAIPEIEVK